MVNIVEERIKKWKDKLIDLSKRNRLLNFRPTKVTTIRIVDEIPSEIFRIFVTDNKTMEFLPMPTKEEKNDLFDDEEEAVPTINTSIQEFQAYKKEELEDKYTDKYLQTNLNNDRLQKNLLRIYSKATSVMEEQGYNALFLALGCLDWYESESSDVKLRSPVILVPVELSRKSVKGNFQLKYTNETPIFNPALVQKLKNDFGITLKLDEDLEEMEPQKIFEMLQETIEGRKRWVVNNDIYLSLFSFAKFIMYKDIEKFMSALLNSPILQLICGQSAGQNVSLGLLEEEKELDTALEPLKTFQILDADSSQQQAILAVKRGKNLVIEGPPGTGKSQTIANIISEFLADDKKVLFVSQKMAALEVVKKRLDNNGIGDFCLELHSRKANKNEFIKEMVRVLEMSKKADHSHDADILKIEELKKQLNDYVKDIHRPYGKLEMTPYQAFGVINKHSDIQDISLIFEDAKNWDRKRFKNCCELLDNLAYNLSKIRNPKQHPWYGSQLTAIFYKDKLKLKELMSVVMDSYPAIESCIEKLKKFVFFNNPLTISEIETLVDIDQLIIRHSRYRRNPLLILTLSFWKDRNLLKKYMENNKYEANLEESFNKIKKIKSRELKEKLSIDSYQSTINALSKMLNKLKDDIKLLFALAKIDEFLVFEIKLTECALNALVKKISNMLDKSESIEDWVRYQSVLMECRNAGLKDFVAKVEALKTPLDKMVSVFKCQFLRCWLDTVFSARKTLNNFYGEDHEKVIQKFCELDRKQIELAKIRIQHMLSGKLDNNYTPSKSSELGVLMREGRKSRAHKSIRKLFEQAPNIIATLKPCIMMSPFSVAQFLNPNLIKFDLVIFDEASQIPSEDSVGSILRGKQIVIAGDNKQLPPTTFFQSEVLTPEDEDDSSVEELPDELDSILDECAVCGIPKTMLRWHYRSRHESLIAFSNRSFYRNRLLTFPCADEKCPDLGIKFHYNPNTFYDRGGKGTNIDEAQEVARAVLKHFKETPELSLGVGTFSIRQKFAILDSIEVLLREDNALEAFFDKNRPEHFFVKNLETIQGDERDVIFISVGYGKSQNGRLSMNFGPINQIGGARRLNVLVTRARRRIEIFSSIRGEDFDLSKTNSEGVQLLKTYLDFAEKGIDTLSYDAGEAGELESPFEESVYNLLISKGLKIRTQVGCSGYKVDLAVLDDNSPGKYVLGIECDGAYYHSSRTARDRDRLRQQVLEDLNWNIYRIWSTDWFKNPQVELDKLLNAIDKAKKGEFSKKKLKFETAYKIDYKNRASNNLKFKIKSYTLTPIESCRRLAQNYFDTFSKSTYVLKAIVEHEGPIHREEAWKRTANYFGYRAVGKRIRRYLQQVEDTCIYKKMIKKKGEFYWPLDMYKPQVRKRDSEETSKKIRFIAPEEIGEAALIVLEKEFSIPVDDLVSQAARLIGFNRITDDVKQYVEKSIELYKKEGKIAEVENRLSLSRDVQ